VDPEASAAFRLPCARGAGRSFRARAGTLHLWGGIGRLL